MTDSTDLLWPPEEMASLMDALARSADRYNSSYGETAHLARNAAKTIRALAATQALAATPAVGGEAVAWIVEFQNKQESLEWSTGGGSAIFYGSERDDYQAHVAKLRSIDFVETVTVTPLYAAPPASPLRPTEEQIDAALNAWFKSPPSETDQGLERSMKAALIAADALRPPASPLRGTAHKVMTPEEYTAMPIVGWHEVCRNVDGFGGVGVRYISASPPEQPAADPVTGRETIREIVHANAKTTLIGFNEISDQNAEFICDQISRKVELALLSTAPDKQPLRYGEPVWPGNENDDLDKGSDA